MNLDLSFGGQPCGSLESLAVQVQAGPDGIAEEWRCILRVAASTAAALEQQLAQLEILRGTEGSLSLAAGGGVVRTLATADCRQGPRLMLVSARDDGPGQALNRRAVVLVFTALRQDALQAVQQHTLTLSAEGRAGQPSRLLVRGRALLRRGENPAAHEATLLPALPARHRRVRCSLTRDTAQPALEYECEDEEVFTALPAGVDDGHYVSALIQDEQGRIQRVTSGFFTGLGALAQARALQPAAPAVLAAAVRENPFSRRVDCEFRELLHEDDALGGTEAVTFTTTRRLVDHPVLGVGQPSWRQEVGAAFTEIVQEGVAVGRDRHVSPPPCRFAADIVERRVQYSVPLAHLPADRRFVTNWRFVSRTRAETVATPPEKP
ncbi:MAG: hypothetical protein IT463_06050 [Planctomycetes bacterium]|nr:hypothetical protein [Planctomycetota bacterium]